MELVKNKLKEGEIIKNSRVLCERLDLPIMKGNTLKHHQAAWKCFFSFHKIEGTNSIMIDKIYDTPKEYVPTKQKQYYKKVSTDNRIRYQSLLKKLILGMIPMQGHTIIISTSKLLYETGFVNKDYSSISESITKQINDNNVSSDILNLMLFQSRINKIAFHDYIYRCFKSLYKNGYLLSYNKVNLIKKDIDTYVLPSEEEQQFIKECESKAKYILTEKKARNNSFAYHYYVYNAVQKTLSSKYGITEVIQSWQLEFNQDKNYDFVDSKQKKEMQMKINNLILERYKGYLLNSIASAYEKSEERYYSSEELQSKYDKPYQIVSGKTKNKCLEDTKKYIEKYCRIK